MAVPCAGASAQGVGNPVGCEGQAEASSSLCFHTSERPFILIWPTKPRPCPQDPLSDQSKEGGGCQGRARPGWVQLGAPGSGTGMLLGHLPACPRRSGFLLSARSNFHPLQIPKGLVRKGKKVLSKVFPFPSQVQAPGVSGGDLAATGMRGNTGGFGNGCGAV